MSENAEKDAPLADAVMVVEIDTTGIEDRGEWDQILHTLMGNLKQSVGDRVPQVHLAIREDAQRVLAVFGRHARPAPTEPTP